LDVSKVVLFLLARFSMTEYSAGAVPTEPELNLLLLILTASGYTDSNSQRANIRCPSSAGRLRTSRIIHLPARSQMLFLVNFVGHLLD
jgi:hypothetical protein